jgi:membrane-associated protease RseP (regulator of RpoE activity)
LIIVWAILVVLFIAFIILTHELGHYFAARAVGIKVEQFSIGFGPEIAGWDRGETRYSLKWILAGGSVRILGMNPEEEVSDEDYSRSYYAAPYWKRAVVVVAGSAVHILMAFLIFFIIFWPIGYQVLTGRIGEVDKSIELSDGEVLTGPASEAGLKKGDIIVSVDGEKVESWSDLTGELQDKPGEEVDLVVRRGGETFEVTVRLLDIDGRGILGVKVDQKDTRIERSSPLEAFGLAAREMRRVSGALFKGFASLFSLKTLKELLGVEPRTQESPQSIVGATRLTFQAAGEGISVFLYVVAYLLLFLAVFNLLPIPPFDGGYLLVIFIEKFFHKEIDLRKLMPIAWVVIIILTLVAARLAVLDIFNPLRNPFTP